MTLENFGFLLHLQAFIWHL